MFYLRDMDINFVSCGLTVDGIVVYDEWFPNQLEVIYKDMSGYIYSCVDNGTFANKDRDIWISQNPVTVISSEYIPDVYNVIPEYVNSGEVQVNRKYETMNDEERKEFNNHMAKTIINNGLLNTAGKKSDFYKRYFPDAWNIALT